jgi:hypothetical protein
MAKRTAAHQRAIDAAKQAERRATKKVSRNEAKGIDLAHSKFDPRVGARNVENMTTNEAKAHARRLKSFLSRGTQFVGLFGNAPARRDRFEEYKHLEKINNDRAAAFIEKYGASALPGQDLTVSARIKMTTPEQRANNQGRVHERIERDARFIGGAARKTPDESLESLIDSMKAKARGDYTSRTVRKRLNSGEGALRNAGFGDLEGEVEALTLEQKQLLVDASTFFDIAVENMVGSPPKSEVKEYRDADYFERHGIEKSEEVYNALREQLDWVKEIAPRGNAATRSSAGGNTAGARRVSRRRKKS